MRWPVSDLTRSTAVPETLASSALSVCHIVAFVVCTVPTAQGLAFFGGHRYYRINNVRSGGTISSALDSIVSD